MINRFPFTIALIVFAKNDLSLETFVFFYPDVKYYFIFSPNVRFLIYPYIKGIKNLIYIASSVTCF